MNNTTKILMIALAAAIAWAIFATKGCNANKTEADDLRTAIKADHDTTKHFTNKFGEDVATKEIVQTNAKDANLFINVDSIARHANVKAKDVKGYTKITTSGSADIAPVTTAQIVYRDTGSGPCKPVRYMTQDFASSYYKASVRVGDSAYLHLKTFDTLSLTKIQTHTGNIFNRRYFAQLDVINSNKDLTVTGVKSYEITDEKKAKAFELDLRSGYMFGTSLTAPVIYAGAGATVAYKRFSLGGSYNRDLQQTGRSFIDARIRFILIKL